MLPSELITLFNLCLDLPRSTHYQILCARIGRLMLDLPIRSRNRQLPGRGISATSILACLKSGSRWSAQRTALAGILLLDALDYLTSLLDHIVGQAGRYEFPMTEHKKRFTKAMGGVLVEFEVPPGWELRFAEKKRLPGFRGIALIRRCHLSDDFTHKNDAISHLAGVPWDYETDVGYFDVPCHLDPNRAIVDGRLRKRKRARPVMDITIPYTFILHEIDRPTLDDIRLIKCPTDQEVLDIAKRAIDRLVERDVTAGRHRPHRTRNLTGTGKMTADPVSRICASTLPYSAKESSTPAAGSGNGRSILGLIARTMAGIGPVAAGPNVVGPEVSHQTRAISLHPTTGKLPAA